MDEARVRCGAGVIIALLMCAHPAVAQTRSVPAQTWPMYQYAADHEAVFATPHWDVRWKTALGGRVNGGLSIVGTTLYVESFDKKLLAFDALTGRERWHATLPNIAMNTPIVAAGRVFAGTGDSDPLEDRFDRYVIGRVEGDSVLAFDAQNGTPLWHYDTIGEDMPTGVYAEDADGPKFVFSNGDDAVRALDPVSGRVVWQRPMIGASTMSSLALAGGRVYGLSLLGFGYVSKTYADPVRLRYMNHSWAIGTNGDYVWHTPYGNSDCSPTVADGMVFLEEDARRALSVDDRRGTNRVYALDARTGAMRWHATTELGTWSADGSKETSIAGLYAHGTFYESLPFVRRFAAFDARTGRTRWQITTHGPVKMSALERDGRVYVGDTAGWFYVIDDAGGAVLQATKFPMIFTASPPVIVGETLFVANDKALYALSIAGDGTVVLP